MLIVLVGHRGLGAYLAQRERGSVG